MARTISSGRFLAGANYLNFGAAANLNVTNSAANDISGLSALTYVWRMRVNAAVNGGFYVCAPQTAGNANQMSIKNVNSTNRNFRFSTSVIGSVDVTGYTFQLNAWFTMAVRYTGANVELWADNVKVFSQAGSTAFATTTTNWLLNRDTGSNLGNSAFAFFRMWKSSLSDANLSKAMVNNYQVGAALNYSFTEGAGTPVDSANASATVIGGAGSAWGSFAARTRASGRTKASGRVRA